MSIGLHDLRPGDIVVIDGHDYLFECRLPPASHESAGSPDVYQFKDRRDFRPLLLTIPEFEQLYADRKLAFKSSNQPLGPVVPTVDVAPKLASRRRLEQYLLQRFDADPVPLSDRKLKEFVSKALGDAPFAWSWMPSPGTMRRLIRSRGEAGYRALYLMGTSPRKPRGSVLHPVVLEILGRECATYWSDRGINKKDVWVATFNAIAEYNERTRSDLKCPSNSTVFRHLKQQYSYENLGARHGFRVADRVFKPVAGSMTADRILEKAIIDHTIVDCFVVDDEYGLPLGRPTLTVMMDVRSRCVLGYYLGFEPPSNHALVVCLERALRPKLDVRSRFDSVSRDWIAYGVPNTIVVDNGFEFTGSSFADACGDLGVSIEWAPIATPQYKGIIERFFGTLNAGLFHKLPGGVPHKPHKMKELEQDAAGNATMRLSELEEATVKFIVDVYHTQIHRTLQAAPEAVWRERAKVDRVRLARDLSILESCLGDVRHRTLSRQGITHDSLTYCSEAVFDLLNDLLPRSPPRDQRKGTVEVKVKVRPDDLGSIFVWNDKRCRYVRLPCTHPGYATGLSSHQHQKIREWAVARNNEFMSERDRVRAKSELKALIETSVPKKMLHRKQHERLKSLPLIPGDHLEVVQTRDSAGGQDDFGLLVDTTSARTDATYVEKSRRGGRAKRLKPVVLERKAIGAVDDAVALMAAAMQEQPQ